MTANHSIAGIARKGTLFLVAKRKPGGDLGGKWEFPGGKLEPGESHEMAMIREWDEEFEVSVSVGKFLCGSTFSHNGKEFILSAFEVHLGSEDFRMNEHSEIRWLTLDSISEMDFAESDRGLLPCLNKMLQKES